MNASDILTIYRQAAPALGNRANAWITMLKLCEAGAEGLSSSQLTDQYPVRSDGVKPALRRWESAGLITMRTVKAVGTKGGRKRHIYCATAKLHQFLRIDQA